MTMAVVEVHGRPECLIEASTLELLKLQFHKLLKRARVDGYHASMILLDSSSFHDGLDNSSPLL